MYERNISASVSTIKVYANLANVALAHLVTSYLEDTFLVDFIRYCFDSLFSDLLLRLIDVIIYPVVQGNNSLGVLFYFIRQAQTWHEAFSQNFMQSRSANIQFLGHASLFLIITFHPSCEFVHVILFFYLYFSTKMRNSATLDSIITIHVKNKTFHRVKEKILMYIKQYVTL